jgi:hypothetical protein
MAMLRIVGLAFLALVFFSSQLSFAGDANSPIVRMTTKMLYERCLDDPLKMMVKSPFDLSQWTR